MKFQDLKLTEVRLQTLWFLLAVTEGLSFLCLLWKQIFIAATAYVGGGIWFMDNARKPQRIDLKDIHYLQHFYCGHVTALSSVIDMSTSLNKAT